MPSPFNQTIRLHMTEAQMYALRSALRAHAVMCVESFLTHRLKDDERTSAAKKYRELAAICKKLDCLAERSYTQLADSLEVTR